MQNSKSGVLTERTLNSDNKTWTGVELGKLGDAFHFVGSNDGTLLFTNASNELFSASASGGAHALADLGAEQIKPVLTGGCSLKT
jgi:hypothetical protein